MSQTVRDRIITWYKQGLHAVDPTRVTREALQKVDPGEGRLVVLAIGKAAVAMASAATEVLGDRIDAGLMVAKKGQISEEVDHFRAIEAAHPIPDEHSLRAGEAVLEFVDDLSDNDTVIALISGGGSALIECPIEGISLMDMQVTTELLMYAGAGIYELNAVRKALSAIKGGGLRRAIGDARCITLMLSDVIGNDQTVIASGPTVPVPSNRSQAWQVIEDFKIANQVPESVRFALTADVPAAPDLDTSRDVRQVVADNTTFVSAVQRVASQQSLRTAQVITHWRDDAESLADRILEDVRKADSDVDVIIGGGEATSVVRGKGRGGRNTETALLVALNLDPETDWLFASLASDGDDGNSGAAGAIVGADTVANRQSAEAALRISDSAGYLQNQDALVITGQTGTNVNDVYIAVRRSAFPGEIT